MHTLNSQGTELYYEERGSGEPLLLLPGASQSCAVFLDNGIAERFARHFRVVLMDFTGLGRSARVGTMRPPQWAEDVVSVLDALGLANVHLGGSSMGARVAARVAADCPDRVRTLLIDLPITSVDEEQDRALHDFFAGYATNGLAGPAQRWHGPAWREAMDFFVAVRQVAGFREFYSPVHYLAEIAAPTLLCRGDGDHPVHPLSQATDWHRDAQASALWIEPGASDMSLMRACPAQVVSQFTRFTSRLGMPV